MLSYSILNKEYYFYTTTGPTVASSQYTSTDSFEDLVDKGLKGDLSFLHVNTRSLKRNKSLLEELIISYRIMSDIIGVCETKLKKK